jgi:hypothetical protein
MNVSGGHSAEYSSKGSQQQAQWREKDNANGAFQKGNRSGEQGSKHGYPGKENPSDIRLALLILCDEDRNEAQAERHEPDEGQSHDMLCVREM